MNPFRRSKQARFSGSLLTIDSLGFVGSYARSSDGAYAVGWDSESGVVVLCQGKSLLASGRGRYPLQGAVADCGTYALVFKGRGESASETVRVFNKSGTPIVTARFATNVYTLSLSSSGSFLACQLCSGDIALLSTADGSTVWEVPTNPAGRHRELAEGLEIDEQNGWVAGRLGTGGTPFRINMAGEHLDARAIADGLLEDARRSPNGLALFYLVRERLDQGEACSLEPAVEQLVELLDESLRIGFEGYPEFEAKAHRAIGEVHERMGQLAEAVRSYETALEKDPKVGIQRRMASLRKRLEDTST